MTAREFLARITSRELSELEALEAVDPLTNRAVVMQVARLCALYFNVHRSSGSAPKNDLDMLVYDHRPEKTPEQKSAEIDAVFRMMFGG